MQQDSGFRRRMQDLSAAFCSLSDGIILLLLHLNADALCVLDPHLLPCTLLERPVSTVCTRVLLGGLNVFVRIVTRVLLTGLNAFVWVVTRVLLRGLNAVV